METYRLSWVQSQSTFVQDQQVLASIDGVAAAQLGSNLPSNVGFIDYDFPTDSQVSWFVRTIGDNATQKDSIPDVFKAENLDKVQAATGLAHTWIAHKD
jgi:hypothetical protein